MQIDWWTLGLQVVNVLVLVWILSRFLFRPIAGVIAERQRATEAALKDAADARKEAEAAKTDAESLRRQFAGEHDKIIAEAREAGVAARKALVDQAGKDIAAMKGQAEEAVAKERTLAVSQTIERAGALAVDIAGRLLGELSPTASASLFVERLCEEVRRLPDDLRRGLTAAEGTAGVEIVTATALADDEAEACRQRVAAVLGGATPVRVSVDPALIAGVELRGPHTVVRASWRGDLDRIMDELKRDADGR